MSFTYMSTYTVSRTTVESVVAPNEPISSYVNQQTYALIIYLKKRLYIDVSRMLLKEQNIVYAQTISAFLTARLTDQTIEGYTSDDLPIKDPVTDMITTRIDAYNAINADDLDIHYTSINNPSVRDDPYQKDTLKDLVFTTTKRDLRNTLVSVNGVFHTTKFFNNELFVLDGFSNLQNSSPTELIGAYDTTSIGGHTIYPITLDQVMNTHEQDPLRGIYLRVPNANFLGKTVFLVIGGYLYALDNTYIVTGQTTLKININKMDLINQWLHNPNTEYYQQFGDLATNIANNNNSSTSGTSGVVVPPTRDQIVFFLQTVYPNLTDSQIDDVMLNQYNYNDLYSYVTKIEAEIPYSQLNAASFVYKILAGPHSFIIAINNPNIYVNHYPLTPTARPDTYEMISEDTPRGILRYNKFKTFPYTILSSNIDNLSLAIPYNYQRGIRQHHVSMGFIQKELDLYKTAYNPSTIISPWFDQTSSDQRFPVEMMDIFSG